MRRHKYEIHYIAWVVAGLAVAITLPIVVYTVALHLRNFHEPRLQRLVIRILWMPAIFGVDNWLALRFKGVALYFTVLTGAYEAWTIHAFYNFLEAYLERGHPPGSLAQLPDVKALTPHKHIIPCCCLRPWAMDNGEFVRKNKAGVLQYTLVQSACTIVTFATEYRKLYHDGSTSTSYAYVYVTVAVNLSQVIALYCLVLFYHQMHHGLAPMKPLYKFLSVKAVVFISFWQSMVISALVYFKAIKYSDNWSSYTVDDVANGLQSFLMCLEMAIIAVAHIRVFPTTDYTPQHVDKMQSMGHKVVQMLSCADAVDDVTIVLGCVTPPEFKYVDGEGPGAAAAAPGADEEEAVEEEKEVVTPPRQRGGYRDGVPIYGTPAADLAAAAAATAAAAEAEEAANAVVQASPPRRAITFDHGLERHPPGFVQPAVPLPVPVPVPVPRPTRAPPLPPPAQRVDEEDVEAPAVVSVPLSHRDRQPRPLGYGPDPLAQVAAATAHHWDEFTSLAKRRHPFGDPAV